MSVLIAFWIYLFGTVEMTMYKNNSLIHYYEAPNKALGKPLVLRRPHFAPRGRGSTIQEANLYITEFQKYPPVDELHVATLSSPHTGCNHTQKPPNAKPDFLSHRFLSLSLDLQTNSRLSSNPIDLIRSFRRHFSQFRI